MGTSTKYSLPRIVLVFILLVSIAGVMRFYGLGKWSFGYDELFTTMETHILMGERSAPEESQYSQLPRLLCAAYVVHWLDYKLFGEDEFGSRVLMAVFGSLSVGVVFLLARPLFGTVGALVLAMLVLLWPEHLLQSQCNRFYSQSFFFLSLVLLLGGHVARHRSVAAAIWLGPSAVLLVLSNSLGGILWGILLGGLLIELLFAGKDERSSKPVLPCAALLVLWSVLLLAIAVFHIIPLAATWNQHVSWGYTPPHAVLAFVNTLGWPYFLLGALGSLYLLLNIRRAGFGYWTFCAAASVLCVALLPLKITYNPLYGFLFAFPVLVAAAGLIERIYQGLAESGTAPARCMAAAWIAVAVLLNLPSTASYYRDGNRPDLRGAFRYVDEHWRDGDRLTGFTMGAADWYLPNRNPKIPLRMHDTAEKLEEIAAEEPGDRLWIVVQSTRGGLEPELLRWLTHNAVFEAKFGKKRFDYIENNVDVFLIEREKR